MAHHPIGYLHIFAQHSEHSEAEIVGTRYGLECLMDAIKHALKYKNAESKPVFVNDGEGYTVEVKCVDDADNLRAPYTYQIIDSEIALWRERAFQSEAECSRLKKINVTDNP